MNLKKNNWTEVLILLMLKVTHPQPVAQGQRHVGIRLIRIIQITFSGKSQIFQTSPVRKCDLGKHLQREAEFLLSLKRPI
ncbi:MAG: hypothetical protein NT004_09965 [Bacteroidetes bacterium]|nr:hypothetical protein [Bacteroidota bacterium]